MRGGRAQKGEAKVELHRTHPGHVDNRPDDTCGRQPAARPPVQVRGGASGNGGRQEEGAGSRHTLRQIIMPGRFSTVMKPKVNCFTMCFTKLSTLEVVPEQFCEVTGFSHSKSC